MTCCSLSSFGSGGKKVAMIFYRQNIFAASPTLRHFSVNAEAVVIFAELGRKTSLSQSVYYYYFYYDFARNLKEENKREKHSLV